ncbi:hypothetical protein [Niabella drilacis]|uniref:Uncharacterized protein n=1 Tax=Niabella drilacis (strain DSM 25811 / CCM 8410 / CCUG 62505 / LMG 26954 / E90) TaxID=1285928 RepID=A0A1G6RLS3_NIADE|nr:hypothetical protein [Niabella drilacis]SDD04945.1 hypothetical protein SAMN04487894_105310 [Niabella drilacis]
MISFRQQTAFSQTELAALLDTSKSSISMHEKSGRSLPLDAERQLLALQKAWTRFLQEGAPPGYSLKKASSGFKRFRSLLNARIQRAADNRLPSQKTGIAGKRSRNNLSSETL